MSLGLIFIFAVSMLLVPANAASDTGWTIFIYLCGSDLESDGGCATSDFVEILGSEYSDDVRVVVQTGGAASWECNVAADAIGRYVRTDEGLELVDALPCADMGSAETLQSFLEWGIENYSSSHMGLIFWNHGGGSITGVCFDELYHYNSLSLSDIGSALKCTSSKENGRFDFIGFDACLMATLETANMLAPYADYMYASEETEPGNGWDYTSFLNYLADNPGANGKELGKLQCESYYAYCMEDGSDPSITFSIIDLSKISDLVSSFDKTCKELSDSGEYTSAMRGIIKADNFGGNNRTEGYTNMVDLADMLRNISSAAPSAKQTLKALEDAVIYMNNAAMHKNAGGLSVYYPLSIQGSKEISIFREICPSTYYYALVARCAEGSDISASSDGSGFADIEQCETMEIEDVYLDEDGYYTVELSSMDELAYASCSLYLEDDDGSLIYLGEDDDVYIDYDACVIQDNFDGRWLCLDYYYLPIELVSQNDTLSIYTCSVLCDDEETNLQIVYDWDDGEYYILGIWDGIDAGTGMAARSAEPLEEGDILNIIYWYLDENDEWDYFESDDIEYYDGIEIYYDILPAADYYYAINLYDIYGNAYELDFTVFNVDEYGDVSFYED